MLEDKADLNLLGFPVLFACHLTLCVAQKVVPVATASAVGELPAGLGGCVIVPAVLGTSTQSHILLLTTPVGGSFPLAHCPVGAVWVLTC